MLGIQAGSVWLGIQKQLHRNKMTHSETKDGRQRLETSEWSMSEQNSLRQISIQMRLVFPEEVR